MIKKIVKIGLVGLGLFVFGGTLAIAAGLTVPQGGTGQSSFSIGALIYSDSALHLLGTTSPTVGYLTATTTSTSTFVGGVQADIFKAASTTASSTFANGLNLTTGCLSYNGTCITQNSGTVTSVATNNGLTGGTITTTGTLGLAAINANSVLGNVTGASAVPTSLATSSLFSGTVGMFAYFSALNTLQGTSSLLVSTASNVGVSSTTPFGKLSVGQGTEALSFSVANTGSSTPSFAIRGVNGNGNVGIGTSSPVTKFAVAGGAITGCENDLATSTSFTLDWDTLGNCNQVLFRTGTAGVTITMSNYILGQTLRTIVCNPTGGTAAGALTFTPVEWAGGSAPSQTTTVKQCDVYSFIVTQATSTNTGAPKIFGAASTGFQ